MFLTALPRLRRPLPLTREGSLRGKPGRGLLMDTSLQRSGSLVYPVAAGVGLTGEFKDVSHGPPPLRRPLPLARAGSASQFFGESD